MPRLVQGFVTLAEESLVPCRRALLKGMYNPQTNHQWRKPGRSSLPLLTRHRVRENGAAVVARQRDQKNPDRTREPPPPPRHLGFGLGPSPPHPMSSIHSYSELRRAWTSHRTNSGENTRWVASRWRPRRWAGEEIWGKSRAERGRTARAVAWEICGRARPHAGSVRPSPGDDGAL
uniref:Uncharacterized protein n=1 Tax=Oryza meridionalis TaxID=40149 RepID=A0A0E0CM85_9ORYZ